MTQRTLANALAPLWALLFLCALAPAAHAQAGAPATGKELYDRLKAATLAGGRAEARGLVLKRDRAEMTFDGTFYFAAPVEGRVTCAVFVGEGRFRADVPPSEFERDNVKRLLGAGAVESDFKTAVLKFSDDTFDLIGRGRQEDAAADQRAEKLAAEIDTRILKETGANLSARLALSLLNGERPGFFFAQFDGGRRGRFNLILDGQNRVPVATFGIDAGEKGLIFKEAENPRYGDEVWMAFHALEDYEGNRGTYADANDLIDAVRYRIEADVRDPGQRLGLVVRLSARARAAGLRAVPFMLGESLPEFESLRQKKQIRLKTARVGGAEAAAVQEDWEGGLTVFLPRPTGAAGETVEFEFELEGDFMRGHEQIRDSFYPYSNVEWYPRHGLLDRASYELTFRHRRNRHIAATGVRLSEEPDAGDKDATVTKYVMEPPVPAATFAVGPFERHTQMVKWDKGGEPIPIEFDSLPGKYAAIKEDFILAEMDNSLRYFSVLFGKYPYPVFTAAFHPYNFGQGLPGMLMIPAADSADKWTFSFIAHETSHQWWGDVVSWRSYRDQWLSEGFAEYSGALYTGFRQNMDARDDLISRMRRSLRDPPFIDGGLGSGRLNDVGPIILGRRLETTKTGGAYEALIYNKGALVLRMLHFLFTDPGTGDDKAFFEMMADFVARYRDRSASTDDFRDVANEHFARTPVARQYRMRDLNWFFRQWVYQTGLPSYRAEYSVEEGPGGQALLKGQVLQENVPDDWVMPLPLLLNFGGDKHGVATVLAYGPKAPFEIRLPLKPKKVELDPTHWVLSEKTSTEAK
ncbi:MAG: M1 family aminopeptidase [Pyrinomonadaceae bacterium]